MHCLLKCYNCHGPSLKRLTLSVLHLRKLNFLLETVISSFPLGFCMFNMIKQVQKTDHLYRINKVPDISQYNTREANLNFEVLQSNVWQWREWRDKDKISKCRHTYLGYFVGWERWVARLEKMGFVLRPNFAYSNSELLCSTLYTSSLHVSWDFLPQTNAVYKTTNVVCQMFIKLVSAAPSGSKSRRFPYTELCD